MNGRTQAAARRTLLPLAIAAVLTMLLAGPAQAHAGLESSDPADGATLQTAPAQVTASFTEPPDPELSSITVVNAAGQEVQAGVVQRGAAPRSLAVSLPPDLPDGVYTVSWVVVSEADGHQTTGAFAFGVGVDPGQRTGPAIPVEDTSGPTPLSVVGKLLLYVGIVLGIGTACSGLWTIGEDLPGEGPCR